ncbi:hypothetical protein BOTBODRAFT_161151 [Botryobasidium botryosum FD-172 SS1]|uniref:DUF1740-domain-containing protein n=1 Tax=Botryobasidium botryosum (strain FD-172 SS1) TaxID=930990 RepID=A0A067MMZ2_BOTB1|nr:hypothetical protein BOTBODRAFT_161151 [Botryobasidium botryosum FD-172 SS1]
MSGTVPSFSSFPPSFGSFPDLEKDSKKSEKRDEGNRDRERKKDSKHHRRDSERDEQKGRHRDSHKGKEKDRRRREDKHRDDEGSSSRHRSRRDKSRDGERKSKREKRDRDDKPRAYEPVYAPEDDSKALFISDRKGDDKNLIYGGVHSYSVPKYRRAGFGAVFGLPRAWRVDRGATPQVRWTGKKPLTRYTASRSLKLIESGGTRRLITASKSTTAEYHEEGFIALSNRRRTNDPDAPDYRSITQDKHPTSDSDTTTDEDSEEDDDSEGSDDEQTTTLTSFAQKSQDLSKAVKSSPTDIDSWLQLAHHSTSVSATSEARATVALSVFERAFAAHPDNKRSPTLRAYYLRMGAALWDAQQLAREWKIALRESSTGPSGGLWVDYLGFVLKSEGVRGIEKAMDQIWDALGKESDPSHEHDNLKLRVFWRACVGLREAGYAERALAAFQAQIELTFFAPSALSSVPFPKKCKALEEFWDSESPRIGDVGAEGWAQWVAKSKEGSNAPATAVAASSGEASTDIPMRESSTETDPYIRWAADERSKEASGRAPVRGEATDDQDPYSAVLFADIQPLLFSPPAQFQARELLLYAFLQFLGLHVPGLTSFLQNSSSGSGTVSSDDSCWAHSRFSSICIPSAYITSNFFDPSISQSAEEAGPSWEAVFGTVVGKERKMAAGWGVLKEWGFGVRSALEGYGVRGEGRMWEGDALEGIDGDFVRRLFEQTGSIASSENWDQHWLAFEAASSVKSALKVSKAILSRSRDSLARWGAHARLERIRGKPNEARKVYQTCLGSLRAGDTGRGVEELWFDWAELEWLEGRPTEAKAILFKMCGEENAGSSSVGVLRVRNAFGHRIKQKLGLLGDDTGCDLNAAACLVSALTLFELLNSGEVQHALDACEPYLSMAMSSLPPAVWDRHHYFLEAVFLRVAFILHHHGHTLRNAHPPALLRGHMERAIHLYPGNTLLLGLWLECERGEAVWGRVRRTVGEVILGQADSKRTAAVGVSRWLWGVWVETWEKGAWQAERVRSVLRKAVQVDNARGSPGIWRLYIEFEIFAGNLLRAKALLHQAIGECPWSKELFLLAFGPLRSAFSRAELELWTNTLVERQIRLRGDPEEYLVGWDEDAGSGSDDSDGEADDAGEIEVEEEARERRRLMPY